MDELIHIIDNNLSPELCEMIIDKYEQDDRIELGTVGGNHDVRKSLKKCDELYITTLEDWHDIDHMIYEATTVAIEEYSDIISQYVEMGLNLTSDTGYKIKSYVPHDEYYHWHYDWDHQSRAISLLWYLNDVDEGGETQFMSGETIKPKQGRLVIFPSTWTYVHRGLAPISNKKYAMTSFIKSE